MKQAAFAIPGDINTITGGYIYERRLLEELRGLGRDVEHIQLAASFPDPNARETAEAVEALCALPPERALILDGLVYGSIETRGLTKVRAPIVAMIHHPLALETGLSAARAQHLFQTERDNLALASHVLVPSPHTAQILGGQYGVPSERITVAQPGSDRHPQTRRPTDPPLILSVGLLHPRKGHDVLLRALAEMTALDWRAVIVGSAHDADHAAVLAKMIVTLGLQDRVTLAGRVPIEELDRLYVQASIFALATRYEGYGMVFDEALLWGLPIVACATGAVPDTVPRDAGALVPVDDVAALSGAMARLLSDETHRAELTQAATQAGQGLPSWRDTARVAGVVLDAT